MERKLGQWTGQQELGEGLKKKKKKTTTRTQISEILRFRRCTHSTLYNDLGFKKSRDPSSSLRNLEDHKVSKSRKQDGSTCPGS